MPTAKKKKPYSARDLAATIPNGQVRILREQGRSLRFFHNWRSRFGKVAVQTRAPTKKRVSLRLSPEVVEHFKSQGPGWQSRIDDTLRKAAKLKAGQVQNRKRARRR